MCTKEIVVYVFVASHIQMRQRRYSTQQYSYKQTDLCAVSQFLSLSFIINFCLLSSAKQISSVTHKKREQKSFTLTQSDSKTFDNSISYGVYDVNTYEQMYWRSLVLSLTLLYLFLQTSTPSRVYCVIIDLSMHGFEYKKPCNFAQTSQMVF